MKCTFYWPLSKAKIVHLKKDLETVLSLRDFGYETSLIVGKLEVDSQIARELKNGNRIRIEETRICRTNRDLAAKFYLKELITAVRLLWFQNPDLIIVLQMWIVAPFVVIVHRIRHRVHNLLRRNHAKVWAVVRIDSDGEMLISDKYRFIWRMILLLNYFAFDKLLVQSTCCASRVKKFIPSNHKLVIIPIGYSSRTFSISRYDQFNRAPVILCVARIVPTKGLHYLMNAFGELISEFPDWTLRFVGPIEDVNYFRSLLCLSKRLGVQGKVKFVGEVTEEELKYEYSKASIFCLPSIAEGSPASRIEAAAMGLPIVTTTAGCGADLQKYGAYVGPVKNSKWLASTLTRLMNDAGLRSQSAHTFQRHIMSWDDVTRSILRTVFSLEFPKIKDRHGLG